MAFGGDILLPTMLRGRERGRAQGPVFLTEKLELNPTPRSTIRSIKHWRPGTIKAALIGVAAACVKEFVGEVVPGFQEQFQRTEEKAKPSPRMHNKSGGTIEFTRELPLMNNVPVLSTGHGFDLRI